MSKAHVEGVFAVKTVTIAASTTLSAAIKMGGAKLAAIEMSTGWTAANITFAVASSSGGTFYPLYDDNGSEVTITSATASRVIAVDTYGGSLASVPWLKVRSGTSASEVTQSTSLARTLYLWTKT